MWLRTPAVSATDGDIRMRSVEIGGAMVGSWLTGILSTREENPEPTSWLANVWNCGGIVGKGLLLGLANELIWLSARTLC